jgi:chloramphenicol 3-O phosphotransferase
VATTPAFTKPGQIVILNGPPRSGKSSIAAAVQETFDDPWMNIGVDLLMGATPGRYRPGIGLRPGGERPDLESFVVAAYAGLYGSIAAFSKGGLNVVVDVGHHNAHSRPLGILRDGARRLGDLPVLFVGVRCPIDVIMARRRATWGDIGGSADAGAPAPVLRWQEDVHRGMNYDLEVDTSRLSAEECAAVIGMRLRDGPPGRAFAEMASASPG